MRADRLLSIMILLQNHEIMTTKELASKLEVSDRTILRDMDALSLAGVPVVADRGKTGGWRLMDHYRSYLSGLKLEDTKALFILPSDQMLKDLGVEIDGLDIRQKLLASLPGSSKSEARHYMEKIYMDTGTWKPSNDKNKALLMIQKALWEDAKLNIVYQKTNGTSSQRVVSPLGLVAKGSSWYLVAMNDEGDYRNFKVSRILEAEAAAELFTRPAQFDLAAYWKQSKLNFAESLPSLEVKVAAHASIIGRLTFTDRFVEKIDMETRAEDEMVSATLRFNTEQEAVEFVLGFGGAMRLVQPEYLIEKVVQQAKAVIAIYE
ncbi:Predicted DNA-binding transcriptional regulator YafY, contains an HTH and WYL domains [Paenibacillus catalpae]|uniref:Predicted DNA-binding transcriptional regulator YafY, contains an HTH and WYL domains n=1 Tax=Paenibacillus catalpae TaxID=1045775 RepID=A0A1I2B6U5_9BACL|nr:YafY family protein [Paenibacillus catalpae]SFE51806.1 Predicted DNA-binding transcriptional regulator YafY, contains an HTH and WYL domains [Paenibacillus catalpae]